MLTLDEKEVFFGLVKTQKEYLINRAFGMSSVDAYRFSSGKRSGNFAHHGASGAKKILSRKFDIEKIHGSLTVKNKPSKIDSLMIENEIYLNFGFFDSDLSQYVSNITSYLSSKKERETTLKKRKPTISDKQRRFAEEYCMNGFNATKAAISAGYSKKTARVTGSEALTKPQVKELIDKLKEEISSKAMESNYIKIAKDLHDHLLNSNIDNISEFCSNAIASALESDSSIKRRRQNVRETGARYAVLERAGFKCQCCGAKPNKNNDVVLHVDHIIPFSLGGSYDMSNLQSLCMSCNTSKGNRHFNDHNEDW